MKRPDCSKTPLTVPFRCAGRAGRAPGDPPIAGLRHSTNGGFGTGTGAAPVPSFPPCLIPAVDGIFRPGGGRSGTVSKTSGRACPNREKLATRDGTSRRGLMGEVCLADEFIL